jgi:Asparagine synthase (glutamine-hydrolyzing)
MIKKQINREALYHYLQLNYIPEPYTIFNDLQKVKKGTYLNVNKLSVTEGAFYKIPLSKGPLVNFDIAAKQLHALVNSSVEKRMISDVPIGSFLSGGLDSSVIAACAREFTDKLKTYSIGFKDEPLYDESKYAELMAKHLNTEHTSFMLTNDDLYNHLYEVLNNIDEPFADSSSIAVSILSKQTKRHVTVALSGDGGDELFGGYNKHKAELIARNGGLIGKIASYFYPIWRTLPKSRNSKMSNIFRQLEKLGHGITLSEKERYWQWCTFSSENNALKCLNKNPDMSLAQNMKK